MRSLARRTHLKACRVETSHHTAPSLRHASRPPVPSLGPKPAHSCARLASARICVSTFLSHKKKTGARLEGCVFLIAFQA